MKEDNTLFDPEEMRSPFDAIKEVDGEVQLSTAIKKILNPSDNCEDTGTILYNLDAIIAVGYRVNYRGTK